MRLRTRIALTCVALLSVVTGAALYAVSAANDANAEREVSRQLEVGRAVFARSLDSNHRQLTQAAQVLAADFGFREAVATNDAATIGSALENQGARIGASLVELVSLDGHVLATAGAGTAVGTRFARADLLGAGGGERPATIAVEGGHIYQLVTLPVRTPLPVAWIVIGFALDGASLRELALVTGLDITLAYRTADGWRPAGSSLGERDVPLALATLAPARQPGRSDLAASALALATGGSEQVTAVLTHSLRAARAPFERLREQILVIALACLSLTAVAAFGLARNITRPLGALTTAIEAIRAGRYDAPLVVERRDELGMLAEGLQLMQQAVASRDHDIRTLAYTDRLTGLMNRTAFAEALAATLSRDPRPVAVAMVNVRRFRRINEYLGYATGDAVLGEIARRLGDGPALASALARVGADQFAAFTPLGPGASLDHWGGQLLERLARPVPVGGQPIDVSVSIGLAETTPGALAADALLRAADLAVERARRENRALRVYDGTLGGASREQLSLLGELQQAVERDELFLAVQPKLALATGALVGAEALVRWRHPTRGLVMPAGFVPFAEQAGFIRTLTRWALAEGARIAGDWWSAGRPLNLSVNISADDLADPGLDGFLHGVLAERRLPSGLLTLELTESGFITDPEQALHRLGLLRRLGVRLSIDDFGTGYSSLAYLTRMPVDELKIDRSFVTAVAGSPEASAVVRAAVEMGHSLGLEVVAEGIEDERMEANLAALGCDVGQGYLYAKPLPLAEFDAWRRRHEASARRDGESDRDGDSGAQALSA